jgi:hypothetical protein
LRNDQQRLDLLGCARFGPGSPARKSRPAKRSSTNDHRGANRRKSTRKTKITFDIIFNINIL